MTDAAERAQLDQAGAAATQRLSEWVAVAGALLNSEKFEERARVMVWLGSYLVSRNKPLGVANLLAAALLELYARDQPSHGQVPPHVYAAAEHIMFPTAERPPSDATRARLRAAAAHVWGLAHTVAGIGEVADPPEGTVAADLPPESFPFGVEFYQVTDPDGHHCLHRVQVTGPGAVPIPPLIRDGVAVWARVTLSDGRVFDQWP